MKKIKTIFSIVFVVFMFLVVSGCEEGGTNGTTTNTEDTTTTDNNVTTTTENNEDEIPSGLTYPEAYARIVAYLDQLTEILDEGTEAYQGDEWPSFFGPLGINLSVTTDLLMVSFTATFGDEDITEAGLQTAFSFFGYENVTYDDQGNRYILEYDKEDYQDEITYHYGYEVDYNPNTDSGKIILYKEYNTANEVIDSIYEFVKTDNGYAIQTDSSQLIIEIANKEVVSFTVAIFEEEGARLSIYDNPGLVDSSFFNEEMEEKMIFDGSTFTYIVKKVDYDWTTGQDTQYRIDTVVYELDGTVVSYTEGDWIPLN